MKTLQDLYRKGYGLSLLGLLMLAIFLFPIYWMILTALRPATEIFASPPHFLPSVFDLAPMKLVLADPKIPRYFLNSAIVGFGCTILSLLLATPASFALAHLPLKGKGLLLLISLSSLMFPAIMIATPMFVIFSRIGLSDSLFSLIVANTTLALPFAITVLRPFFLAIPKQLTEAARIDGCTTWGAFWRVIIPVSLPGLLTTAIFTFLLGWGDLLFAITMVNSDAVRPITAGIYSNIGNNSIRWNNVMALSSVAMLPPLVLFLITQRYVVRGLTVGAVKE